MQRYLALQKIVEMGSFSKAAEFLGYTQSGISQMIASLEKELSIKLLSRSRSGAVLTHEGSELYPYIEQMIYRYFAMEEKAKDIKGLDTGIIRMGAMSSITAHWMPSLLKEFNEKYPKVEFVINQGDYSLIQEWIKTGAVDFGFMTPSVASGLEITAQKEGALLAVLPQNHPLAQMDVVPLELLAKEPYILVKEGHYHESMEAFEAIGAVPDVRYTVHDDYAIMTMVEAGLGVSILAELILQRTNYNIAIRPLDPPLKRTLAICYKDKDSLSVASRRFIQLVKRRLDELP